MNTEKWQVVFVLPFGKTLPSRTIYDSKEEAEKGAERIRSMSGKTVRLKVVKVH